MEYLRRLRRDFGEDGGERKLVKNCHGCGLESADDCPERHMPTLESYPCEECIRNPEVREALENFLRTSDHYNEAWALNENNKPIIES
jgi:methionyl-tRNA synthetase